VTYWGRNNDTQRKGDIVGYTKKVYENRLTKVGAPTEGKRSRLGESQKGREGDVK